MKNLTFVFAEKATGLVTLRGSAPDEERIPACPDDFVIVIPADLIVPPGEVKLDRRKIKERINYVESVKSVQTKWVAPAMPAKAVFTLALANAVRELDERYARRIDTLKGPLSALHAEKRRQAEAGVGPLIVDETERLAILANAAEEDEKVALIERERREIKSRLKAATSVKEIESAMAQTLSKADKT